MWILRVVVIRISVDAIWVLPWQAGGLLHGIASVPPLRLWRLEPLFDEAADLNQIRVIRVVQWNIAGVAWHVRRVLRRQAAEVVLVELVDIILPRLALLQVEVLPCICCKHGVHILRLVEAHMVVAIVDELAAGFVRHVVGAALPLIHRVMHIHLFILLIVVDGRVVNLIMITRVIILHLLVILVVVHSQRMIDHLDNIVIRIIKRILKVMCVIVGSQILPNRKRSVRDEDHLLRIRAKLQLTSILLQKLLSFQKPKKFKKRIFNLKFENMQADHGI